MTPQCTFASLRYISHHRKTRNELERVRAFPLLPEFVQQLINFSKALAYYATAGNATDRVRHPHNLAQRYKPREMVPATLFAAASPPFTYAVVKQSYSPYGHNRSVLRYGVCLLFPRQVSEGLSSQEECSS